MGNKKVARPKGRPKGARNKPKPEPAPKPKGKAKAKKAPIEYDEEEFEEEEEEEEEIPQTRTKTRRAASFREAVVPELDRCALAADMLGLLQEQHYNRASSRRNHYASWYQNM